MPIPETDYTPEMLAAYRRWTQYHLTNTGPDELSLSLYLTNGKETMLVAWQIAPERKQEALAEALFELHRRKAAGLLFDVDAIIISELGSELGNDDFEQVPVGFYPHQIRMIGRFAVYLQDRQNEAERANAVRLVHTLSVEEQRDWRETGNRHNLTSVIQQMYRDAAHEGAANLEVFQHGTLGEVLPEVLVMGCVYMEPEQMTAPRWRAIHEQAQLDSSTKYIRLTAAELQSARVRLFGPAE